MRQLDQWHPVACSNVYSGCTCTCLVWVVWPWLCSRGSGMIDTHDTPGALRLQLTGDWAGPRLAWCTIDVAPSRPLPRDPGRPTAAAVTANPHRPVDCSDLRGGCSSSNAASASRSAGDGPPAKIGRSPVRRSVGAATLRSRRARGGHRKRRWARPTSSPLQCAVVVRRGGRTSLKHRGYRLEHVRCPAAQRNGHLEVRVPPRTTRGHAARGGGLSRGRFVDAAEEPPAAEPPAVSSLPVQCLRPMIGRRRGG